MNPNIVRFSLDMPKEMHLHLKVKAAKMGISLREYILESVASKEGIEDTIDVEMDKETFQRVLNETRKEYRQLFKNLSKK